MPVTRVVAHGLPSIVALIVVASMPEPEIGDANDERDVAADASLREPEGRRLRVVDPEAEREGAGAGGGRAVEDDVVAAGERPDRRGREHRVAELRRDTG